MKKIAIFLLLTSLMQPLCAAPPHIKDAADAVMSGRIGKVRNFIDEGGDVNEPVLFYIPVMGEHETSLLHLAIANLQQEIVHLLLEEGAHINIRDTATRTPLLEAMLLLEALQRPRKKLIERISDLLTDALALAAIFPNMNQVTAHSIAIGTWRKSHVAIVSAIIYTLLADGDFDLSAETFEGATLLHLAIVFGNKEWVERLIALGANPFVKKYGITGREFAKKRSEESDNPQLYYDIYEIVKSSSIQPPPRSTMHIASRRLAHLYAHLTGSNSSQTAS